MSAESSLLPEIEYPESDGRPMGETELHRKWMIRIIDWLEHRYRDQRVYVSGDLLVYYEEGNPRKFVVPDAFVVLDCAPHDRRIFKIWEEGRLRNVAIETTSRSTRRVDERKKPKVYELLGVAEYFLYDPTSDYLDPPLQGHRLGKRGYERINPDASGRLASEQLGVYLLLQDGELVMTEIASGERLLTAEEAVEVRLEAERRAREAAENEVKQLRERMRRHGLAE